jgi:hypothetical protein
MASLINIKEVLPYIILLVIVMIIMSVTIALIITPKAQVRHIYYIYIPHQPTKLRDGQTYISNREIELDSIQTILINRFELQGVKKGTIRSLNRSRSHHVRPDSIFSSGQ